VIDLRTPQQVFDDAISDGFSTETAQRYADHHHIPARFDTGHRMVTLSPEAARMFGESKFVYCGPCVIALRDTVGYNMNVSTAPTAPARCANCGVNP
jgi:hypothetical protein